MQTRNSIYTVPTVMTLLALLLGSVQVTAAPVLSPVLGSVEGEAKGPVLSLPAADLNAGWEEVGTGSASGGGISDDSGNSLEPSMAVASDGTSYVAWHDYSGGGLSEIYIRRWSGSVWEEVGIGSASGGGISDNGGSSQEPAIAIALDNTPYVAWIDDSGGGYSQIYVRRWNGSSWEEVGAGSANGGGISNNGGNSLEPSAAIAPDGTPYVAWRDNSGGDYEIYVLRWNGSSWEEVGAGSASGGGISDNSGRSRNPALAIAPDGTPYVAWRDDSDGGYEIYVLRWNGSSWEEVGAGSASGGGVSGNSGDSRCPAVAIAPDGRPYVVWEDDSSGDREIYVRRWSGSSWEEVGAGSASGGGISDNGGGSANPAVAIAMDGTPYVAWLDDSGGGTYEIYVRCWNGSSWEEVGAGSASGGGISDNSGWSGAPSVTIAPDGTSYVAWSDYSYGDAEVYVRRNPLSDLSIVSVTPLQALEGQDLVVGKATAVKVVVQSDGTAAVSGVPVTLTYNGQEFSTFYVAEGQNIGADFSLLDENTAYPLSFPNTPATKTIYFFDPDLTPTSTGTYQVSVKVQHAYDTDPSNNSAISAPVNVRRTSLSGSTDGSVELVFLSVDNAAATSYMGARGTEQFAAMFPVAESLVSDRHLGSLSAGATGRLGFFDFYFDFLFQLYNAMKLASPTSSRYIAVLPPGWFREYHPVANDAAGQWFPLVPRMVLLEAGWQSPQKMLHELGHSFGLHTSLEEYDSYPDGIQVTNGLDVEHRRLMQHGVENKYGQTASVYSIMGEDRPSVLPWIKPADYDWLLLQHTEASDTSGLLLVSGVLSRSGEITLADWWRLPSGLADSATSGDYTIEMRDGGGSVLYTHCFSPTFVMEGGASVDLQPFAFAIPYPVGTSDVHIVRNGSSLASRHVTSNPPQVSVVSPNGGEVFIIEDTIPITWNGSDADDDTLSYAVLYSGDDGVSWQTLDIGLTTTNYQIPAAALALGTRNRIKVIATDGVNTGQDISGFAFTVVRMLVYLPLGLRDYTPGTQPLPPANNPPNVPSNPSPADGATNQSWDVGLSWTGGDPDGDSVTYDVYFEAGDSTPDVLVSDDQSGTSYDPGTLSVGTYYYWQIVATDEHGATTTGPVWSFLTESAPPVVGPIVYEAHTIDDDTSGESNGNGDGIINPGETIELYVSLTNLSTYTAISVTAVLTTTDPYVSAFLGDDSSAYPDIPGGGTGQNVDDWDFVVDPTTPDGHVITFYLDPIAAGNGGPWTDSFTVTVEGLPSSPPYIPTVPGPPDGATMTSIATQLVWTGGDPDSGNTVTYDVYLGTSDPPTTLVCDDVSVEACDPGPLTHSAGYYWYVVATDDTGRSTTGPVWQFVTAPDGLLPVAVFDYSKRPSYFSGLNTNQWLTYFSILDDDPEGRFQVGVVADLSAATLAPFERLVLPDNAVPDMYLSDVAAWFTSGRRVVAVDSAVCYAAYSGFMWPASTGSNGRDVYWDYSSLSNDQEVIRFSKTTEDYNVGDVLTSRSNDAQMYASLLPEGTLALTAKTTDHNLIYVAERWVAGEGSIVVLGPYAPVPSGTYSLVRDAVEGAVSPLVYYDHTIDDNRWGESNGNGDGIINPGETIELDVSLANLGTYTAQSVTAVLATTDPYVSAFLYNDSSTYPNIPGGGTRQNDDDWDFVVDPATPDGHVITFYLNPISASNGGPWVDSFNVVVSGE